MYIVQAHFFRLSIVRWIWYHPPISFAASLPRLRSSHKPATFPSFVYTMQISILSPFLDFSWFVWHRNICYSFWTSFLLHGPILALSIKKRHILLTHIPETKPLLIHLPLYSYFFPPLGTIIKWYTCFHYLVFFPSFLPFRYSSFSHYLPHRYPQLPCLLHPIQHCSLQGSSSEPSMIASNRSLCAKICASHPFSVMYRHP